MCAQWIGADADGGAATIAELMRTKVQFHKTGENYKTDGYVITERTMDLLKDHLKLTGGQVRTRFPPEPNGILHIGHAKAININFGYAEAHNGICFLRYDDTNPEKEEEKFFVGIKQMVEWLGKLSIGSHGRPRPFVLFGFFLKTWCFRRSVDRVQAARHHSLVGQLPAAVRMGQGADPQGPGLRVPPESRRDQGLQPAAVSVEGAADGGESAAVRGHEERQVRRGPGHAAHEGDAGGRETRPGGLPHQVRGPPPHRRSLVHLPHVRLHALPVRLHRAHHSLAVHQRVPVTVRSRGAGLVLDVELELDLFSRCRRSSYYWLCNALDIYCPVQWEYGRLNVHYTVVSKRKIAKLISEAIVEDWDDPRLFTLTALRRRGFPAEAINNFCARMGLTGAQAVVDPQMLEAVVKDTLNVTAPRTMVVLPPLKGTIRNLPADVAAAVDVPDFPTEPQKGTHSIALDRVVYIDRSDFREVRR